MGSSFFAQERIKPKTLTNLQKYYIIMEKDKRKLSQMNEKTRVKHKKNIMQPISESALLATLRKLKESIMTLGYKQQFLLDKWLNQWSQYLREEKAFNPQKLRYYKRGEIVLVDFGYNVGCELGGIHYAIVIENNNNNASGQVVVIPISSLETNVDKNMIHKSEVYLGKAIGDVESYAKPLQIRAISKQRIRSPKYPKQKIGNISNELLAQIDEKIVGYFLKQG